jgi:putative transposase
VREKLHISERRVCRVIDQPRSTQRNHPLVRDGESYLRAEIIRLAGRYGRYGYRRITALLKQEGFRVNHKRVERIWRQEGLKVPKKQPKRGRLWFNDGSCIRLRPTHRNHVWSYDFVSDRTHDGRAIKMLTVIDEFSRECLAIVAE